MPYANGFTSSEALFDLSKFREKFQIYEEFTAQTSTAQATGHPFFTSISGGTCSIKFPDDARIGVQSLSTSTSATGRAAIVTPAIYNIYGGTVTLQGAIKIPTLSVVATERFWFRFGFADSTGANPANQISFTYDSTNDSTHKWQVKCTNASTSTTVNTSANVTTNEVNLKIVATTTSAQFYIDGVLVHTITTNIPASATQTLQKQTMITKSVGTTARTVELDWIYISKDFDIERK